MAEARVARRRLVWVPNAVTSVNLLLGFLSILFSLQALKNGEGPQSPAYSTAAWLVLWATLGDVLDGKLAKWLNASSDFGMRMDTFADAVTFGLAPSVLLYAAFLKDAGSSLSVALAPAAYFLAACFRLARYNVQSVGGPRFGFTGVPTPTAAIIAVTLYLGTLDAPWSPGAVAALTGLLALAMVSPLRYPAFKGLRPRELKAALAILAVLFLSMARWGIPKASFYAFASFALVWGWWWVPLRPLWVPGADPND